MYKKLLISLPDILLVCIVFYITYTKSFSFGQTLVISIAIIGGLVIRICKDVFTYIRWTIKQRKC
ncbi:hypothetical protein COJ42_20175 [Bacillus cereus]|nr:hypothetical protein CN464_14270 [Bacillus cereus]PFM30724.1 hypothetical protein COJ42_20175 [Bacillus cereus]PFP90664.1 hypothetical protein COK02_15105 [Bacillus cereus]